MKRALAEDDPTIFGGDPDAFAARLAYEQRDIEEDLQMVESIRKHMARILRTLQPDAFQRRVLTQLALGALCATGGAGYLWMHRSRS